MEQNFNIKKEELKIQLKMFLLHHNLYYFKIKT